MTNIQSLIGYFDIDPTRALDLILDVFSDNIVHHHAFFRDLIALARRDARRDKPKDNDIKGKQPEGMPIGMFENEVGDSVCAQIVGFKFQFYQVSLPF